MSAAASSSRAHTGKPIAKIGALIAHGGKLKPATKPVVIGMMAFAIMNFTTVVSMRGLPAQAEYGLASIFYYVFAAVVFLIPTSLVAAELASTGAHLDAVLACAYHEEGREPLRVADHPWRKPKPGMILEAASRMNINLARSWIVGDRAHDLAAGQAGWLPGGTLLSADPKERQAAFQLDDGGFIVETAANLADAVGVLIDRGHFWDHELSRRGPLTLVERSTRNTKH